MGSKVNSRACYRWTSHVIIYNKDNYQYKYIGPYPESETTELDYTKPINIYKNDIEESIKLL